MDNTQELQQCKQFISAGKLSQALEIINKLEQFCTTIRNGQS